MNKKTCDLCGTKILKDQQYFLVEKNIMSLPPVKTQWHQKEICVLCYAEIDPSVIQEEQK